MKENATKLHFECADLNISSTQITVYAKLLCVNRISKIFKHTMT